MMEKERGKKSTIRNVSRRVLSWKVFGEDGVRKGSGGTKLEMRDRTFALHAADRT